MIVSCSATLGRLLSSFRSEQSGGTEGGRALSPKGEPSPEAQGWVEAGKSPDWGVRSQRRLGAGGMRSPTPTSGFMMSDSARAFPRQGQRPIESGVGPERLGPREERDLVRGLWGRTRRSWRTHVTAFHINTSHIGVVCLVWGVHHLSGCELKAVPGGGLHR